MAVQTEYKTYHDEAYAGMRADLQLSNPVSKLNKGTATIPFGKAIVTDGENGGKLPVAGSTAAQFIGVSIRELNRANKDGDPVGAVAKQDFSVETTGVIWVKAAESVAKDDPVFFRVGSTNTGDFAKAAGSGVTAAIEIKNAKFLTSGSAGELVKISLKVGG